VWEPLFFIECRANILKSILNEVLDNTEYIHTLNIYIEYIHILNIHILNIHISYIYQLINSPQSRPPAGW
jgi:hypothetical protein